MLPYLNSCIECIEVRSWRYEVGSLIYEVRNTSLDYFVIYSSFCFFLQF